MWRQIHDHAVLTVRWPTDSCSFFDINVHTLRQTGTTFAGASNETGVCKSSVKFRLLTFASRYVRNLSNKKYVLSNPESLQCDFFIFDHVTTFIQFKICCCIQNFMKIG